MGYYFLLLLCSFLQSMDVYHHTWTNNSSALCITLLPGNLSWHKGSRLARILRKPQFKIESLLKNPLKLKIHTRTGPNFFQTNGSCEMPWCHMFQMFPLFSISWPWNSTCIVGGFEILKKHKQVAKQTLKQQALYEHYLISYHQITITFLNVFSKYFTDKLILEL